jgi:hypothetical protein
VRIHRELFMRAMLLATPPPGVAPLEVPAALIITVAVVSVAAITTIVGKGIRRQRERRGEGIPAQFTRHLNVTSVALIMVLLGALAPYIIVYRSYTGPTASDVYFQLELGSYLWSFFAGVVPGEEFMVRLDLLPLPNLAWSLVLLAFYLVYVYELTEYCQGQAHWTRALLAWLFSQLPFLVMLIPEYLPALFLTELFYEGPTFITLIAGLIIMRIVSPMPSREPWASKEEE